MIRLEPEHDPSHRPWSYCFGLLVIAGRGTANVKSGLDRLTDWAPAGASSWGTECSGPRARRRRCVPSLSTDRGNQGGYRSPDPTAPEFASLDSLDRHRAERSMVSVGGRCRRIRLPVIPGSEPWSSRSRTMQPSMARCVGWPVSTRLLGVVPWLNNPIPACGHGRNLFSNFRRGPD